MEIAVVQGNSLFTYVYNTWSDKCHYTHPLAHADLLFEDCTKVAANKFSWCYNKYSWSDRGGFGCS